MLNFLKCVLCIYKDNFFIVFPECINMLNDIDRFPDAEPSLHPGDKLCLVMKQSFCLFPYLFWFVFNVLDLHLDLVNILFSNCYLCSQVTVPGKVHFFCCPIQIWHQDYSRLLNVS